MMSKSVVCRYRILPVLLALALSGLVSGASDGPVADSSPAEGTDGTQDQGWDWGDWDSGPAASPGGAGRGDGYGAHDGEGADGEAGGAGAPLGEAHPQPTRGGAPVPGRQQPVVAPTREGFSVSDWDWEGAVTAPEGPAPAPSAGSTAGPVQAGETDLGDWDWEGIDELGTPAAPESAVRTADDRRRRKGPRVGETAHPDFSRDPEPGHKLFAEAPEFLVVPSQKDPDMHPCDDCHEWAESDLTPRVLQEPHDNFVLTHGLHGRGEFWCFTCHDLEGEGGLRTLEGLRLDFDEAYTVCAQCHAQEARDWSFGAHGKRVGNWNGDRVMFNCTVCHYQHRPRVAPRSPRPPRPVPAYTAQRDRNHSHPAERPWERYERRYAREKGQ